MTSPAITIQSDASLADAAALMLSRRIGCLPVLDGSGGGKGRLIGLITDDSFFPREKQVPYTHERLGWLFGEWLGDIDQLDETLRSLRERPVTDGLIARRPVADYTVAVSGLTVVFTDTSTGRPTDWAWDFGDGNSSRLQNPTHTYAAVGTYTVELEVSNSVGDDRRSRNVAVTGNN